MGFCSENSQQRSFPTQLWISYKRDLLLYLLLGGSVSTPPPAPNSDSLFSSLLLSVSCYHISLYFTPTPTPTLSPGPSVHISHSRLGGCGVKRHFNIHEDPRPLIFTLTHQRGPHSFWEYLHSPSAVARCSQSTSIIALTIITTTAVAPPTPRSPSFLLGGSIANFRALSRGSAAEAGSAAFVSFFFSFLPLEFYLILTRLN